MCRLPLVLEIPRKMQLPVQHSSLGSKAPAAFHTKSSASRRGRAARLVPQAAAVVDKPAASQSHTNGNGNGSSAYGKGAYADGNSTNGASHKDGPVVLNGQVCPTLPSTWPHCPVTCPGSYHVQPICIASCSRSFAHTMPAHPPDLQILHNISKEKLELVGSIDAHLASTILPILKDTAKIWQPADFLPDPASDTFIEEVTQLRERTAQLPDDYLVVLIGDLVTEEALPTYMAMLNTLDGVRDETGAAPTPWAR